MSASQLTPYERRQANKIAGWKAECPSLFRRAMDVIEHPLVVLVEKLIPEEVMRAELKRTYQVSELFVDRDEVLTRAGVTDIEEINKKGLDCCDSLAEFFAVQSTRGALERSTLVAVTGGASPIVNTPIIIMQALKSIHTIGICYGFSDESLNDQAFAFGILQVASCGTLAEKQKAVCEAWEQQEELVSETVEEMLEAVLQGALERATEEYGSERVPFVGAAIGAAVDGAFANYVTEVAIFAYQERWLRKRGKLQAILPDPRLARGQLRRLESHLLASIYWVSFTTTLMATFPPLFVWSLVPRNNPLVQGLIDGAMAADHDLAQLKQQLGESLGGRSRECAPAPPLLRATA
ncbi:MAG TPA: EcsC family protein [Pirellulales bacterium]|jgi:hypothetical protein|nr:EcsC family protein [Pirellulales bacterium]